MSLSENLHNLGTLLKTNLETKGINGLTGNEGLTTLANKILDIEGSSSSSKSVVAHITGNNVTIGKRNSTWLIANDATINWGDGTSNTVDNPQETLSHTYTDGVNEHLIALDGTITGLGIDCFYGCTGLTSIFIPNSITSIGARCFIDCSGLTSVVIPNSVTSLGTSCFRGCSSLINVIIPNSITSLGNNCFDGCSSLTNVVIPNSVTSLGTSCFKWCSGLTSVIIPNSISSLGNDCFYGCTGLTSIFIPNSITSIGNNCFNGCSSLTNVVIPNSVTSLGTSCFKWCSGLTSVIIPNSISSLGIDCFYGCTGLTSIFIPNSITSIGARCFIDCSGLTSVTIPSSVTSLGGYCFSNCTSLIDYQLYWTGNNIITYNSDTMPNNTNTIFTIPQGETANYTAKGYPTAKLVERGETLTLTADKSIIQKTETSTITATLKQSGSPLTGKTLNYQVKHGSTVISSGTKTTNSSGQATISYTGTGIGDVDVIVSYGSLLQETYEVLDCWIYDDMETDKYLTNYRALNSANISYSTEYAKSGVKSLKWAYSPGASNANYLGMFYTAEGTSPQLPLSPLLNKQLRFEIDTKTTDTIFYVAVYIKTSANPTWRTISSKSINSGEQSTSVDFTVPSNCTYLWVRANVGGSSSGTLYIDNWKIYSI